MVSKLFIFYFSRIKNINHENIILFINKFDDLADAKQRKVELNREMPKTIREVSVSVRLTHFHPHPNDEKKRFYPGNT